MTPPALGPVCLMGAGSVGCWVGGRLLAAGAEVHFVGRPRVLADLARQGLKLTDIELPELHLAPSQLHLHEQPPPAAALVLLCVKSGATAEAARQLARLPAGTPVLSLQNGVDNAAIGAAQAPAPAWLPGMVPFNIAELAPGHFHRGTTGALAAQDHPALRPWLPVFLRASMPLALHADLAPVQWGKLLLNLNNPVNALCGLPLRAQLLDRDLRCVLAALQTEALHVLRSAGIRPAQVAALPPAWMPRVLRLPNWAFERIAARLLRIDGQARSSMADDVALGRQTEIDALSGAIVRLARGQGGDAPLNRRMQQWLQGSAVPRLSGREMRAALGV
jgi:2-dehydropantoate 2-reductase